MITRGRGYTILEVLIFIAISAFIFVSAMVAVNGRQQQVQFSQSVREFDAKINDVINDVSTGYFPTNTSISCIVNPGDRPIVSGGSNDGLGTNSDCLFVGKVFQFVPSPSEYSENETKFLIYNLVGRRYSSGIETVKNISEAKPVAVANTNGSFTDPTELAQLRFGVKVTKVFDVTSGSETEYGLVGVLSNFEGSRPSFSSVSSSQSTQIGGILLKDSDGFRLTKQNAIYIINFLSQDFPNNNGYINTESDSGVVICLKDPDNRKASITVGASGASGTLLQFDDYDLRCDS